MPEIKSDGRGKETSRFYGPDKDDEQISSAIDKSRLSSTAGTGLGSKGRSLTGAPRQEPGESPSQYAEKMRKWREVETQRKAFGGR